MEFVVDVINVDVDVDVGQEEPNLGGGGGMSVMEGVLSIVGRGGGVPESDDDPRRSMLNLPSNNDAETSKLLMPLPLPPPLLPPP